ncbi:eukaryotic translation initiation factor 3 subunit G [Sphaerosporella brunnea]|uniref:Eukaryotic translation initiation factor 3 subunit G n=1 Tax=Sphaerosporella brunnea TaxID=1250544 RepID=A0A5J5F596_9PEZI|nr:eukaryotic translation initiation factor 3 subunit G [Sphaerosporella brunnea]
MTAATAAAASATPSVRANWADDFEADEHALPPQEIVSHPDGTKTIVTYQLSPRGTKIRTTRRIRTSIVQEHVNPRVAERKSWAKFGREEGRSPGPDLSTTSVGENIVFKPSANWKATRGVVEEEEAEAAESKNLIEKLRHKQIACRICRGDHFTSKCPFRDTLPPLEDTAAATSEPEVAEVKTSGAYVAPHLRGKGRGGGESMAGGRDRDDLATLRVTNISEFAEEHEIRDLFERYGRVTRMFLAKDRDTGRPKGFAFVNYADRVDAERACAKMDGFGYGHLILKVEFAKKSD